MYKCPHCFNNLSFKEIKCPICHNYLWRLPHIIIAVILILTVGIGAIVLIDHYAVNKIPADAGNSNINLPHKPRRPAPARP